MSLTSFLAQPPVRSVFKAAFPKPEGRLAEVSEAAIPSTGRPQLMGTAFDYLARFAIERAHPEVPVNQREWVAERAVARMKAHGLPADQVDDAARHVRHMRSIQMDYAMMGNLSDELIGGCIDMAKLDTFFRSGYPSAPLGNNPPEAIEEMRALLERADEFVHHPCQEIHLNPTFGSWSSHIGGADADVIYDRELTDIKTVKERKVRLDDHFQLMGYALLSDLAIEDGEAVTAIDSVALYYSRFGAWWTVDIQGAKESDTWIQMKDFMRSKLAVPE